MKPVAIEVVKPLQGRRYRSRLHRSDGVVVELDGGSYNKVGGDARELPHDLAHFIVEDAFELTHGLWGVLAAGGLFNPKQVVAGRQPPHAAKRGRAIVAAATEQLLQSEVLTRGACDLCIDGADRDVRRLQAVSGERWRPGITADALADACRRLRDGSIRWRDLAPGEALTVEWRLPPPR